MEETNNPINKCFSSVQQPEKHTQKAAIYIRVGSCQLPSSKLALKEQELVCREIAEKNGLDVVAVYQDIGGGNNINRTGLNAMLQDASARKFGTIIAAREDCLYRGAKSMTTVLQAVLELNLSILLGDGVFDGHLIHVKMWIACSELATRRERGRALARIRKINNRSNNAEEE